MAEETPLLDDINEITSHIDNTNEEFEGQAHLSAEHAVYFRILSIITLILSVVAVPLLVANYIIIDHAPIFDRHAPYEYYFAWWTSHMTKNLAIWIFVSAVFSSINVLVNNVSILLNVIADIVLAGGIISGVVYLFEWFPNFWWCRIQPAIPMPGNPHPAPIYPHPKCETWKLVVEILMGFAGSLGAIIAIIYLSLLVLQSIAIIRTKFWKRPSALSFPTGQISFEVSIKFLRHESATPANTTGQSAEGLGSGHGPLHL